MIETAAIARFGLLIVRPGMLVVATPVFGGLHVPVPVRIALGVLLGIVIAPVVPAPGGLGPVGLPLAIASELMIGLAIGLAVRVLVAAAELGGHVASFQLGLSYAAFVDPLSGVRNSMLAALYANLALVTFLGINGHHAVIRALVESYAAIPVGSGGISGPFAPIVLDLLGIVFVTGAKLAAPVVTVVLLVELALGLIARAAPALNLMIVGTPVRLLAGLLALAVGVQVIPGVIASVAGPALEAALRLVEALG